MTLNEQSLTITKANDLIRKSRYNLTVKEHQILMVIMQQIHMDDDDFKIYEFSIRDFCSYVGIKKNGKSYSNIKNAIKKLSDKSFWISNSDGSEVLVRWMSKIQIEIGKGIIKIRLDEDLKPYLIKLKGLFTQYNGLYFYSMKVNTSPRLYELLKSYQFKQSKFIVKITICELRNIFDLVDKYLIWTDFKRYVIDRAIEEINNITDLNVTYETERKGRNVNSINFYVNLKESFEIAQTINKILARTPKELIEEDINQNFVDYKPKDLSIFETDFAKNLWKTKK